MVHNDRIHGFHRRDGDRASDRSAQFQRLGAEIKAGGMYFEGLPGKERIHPHGSADRNTDRDGGISGDGRH